MPNATASKAWMSQDKDPQLTAIIRRSQTSTGVQFISRRALSERFSGHGVPRTVGNTHPLRKLCWLVVTVVFSVFMVWQCYKVTNEYRNYKKITLVEMEEVQTPTFPAVTICNQNSLDVQKIKDWYTQQQNSEIKNILAHQDLLVKLYRMDEVIRNIEKCNLSSSVAYSAINYYLQNDSVTHETCVEYDSFAGKNEERRKRSAEECSPWSREAKGEEEYDDYISTEDYIQEYETDMFYYPDFAKIEPDDVLELLKRSQSDDLSDFQSWIAVSASKHRAFGYNVRDIVKSCTFNGDNCNPKTDFFLTTNERYGNCYTFNSKMNRKTRLKMTSKYGSKYGLKITLDSLAHTYLNILSPDIGFRLSVHDPAVISFPEDVGIDVPRNHKVSIAVAMTELERLGIPYGSCSEKDWKFIGQYSVFGCRKICFNTMVEKSCGCKTTIQDLTRAKSSRRLELCDITNKTQLNCKIEIQKEFSSNNNKKCQECTAPCSETKYAFDLSTSNRNNEFQSARKMALTFRKQQECNNDTEESLNSMNFNNPDLVDIHIYLKSKSVEKISEKPAYTWDTFVSNFGGNIGLCLGLSLITVVEILEYLLDIILYLLGFHDPKEKHVEEVTIEFPAYNTSYDEEEDSDVVTTKNDILKSV